MECKFIFVLSKLISKKYKHIVVHVQQREGCVVHLPHQAADVGVAAFVARADAPGVERRGDHARLGRLVLVVAQKPAGSARTKRLHRTAVGAARHREAALAMAR